MTGCKQPSPPSTRFYQQDHLLLLFQINFNHQAPEAIIKRSRVAREATFAGVTKGVALKLSLIHI